MILKAKGLNKSFAGLKAVSDFDLEITAHSIVSIIGPNGSGKSTLFNLITSHLPCDSGEIIFNGERITGLPSYHICRKGIGRSFQRINIFKGLSTYENIQIAILCGQGKSLSFLRPARSMVRDQTEEILIDIGLIEQADTLAGKLAYGDQRSLEFGIALSNSPKLVLLDEPTSGMSPEESAAITNLISDVVERRKITLLFVEHDMRVVFGVSEKIIVMNRGRKVTEGSPDEISQNEDVRKIYLGEK